MVIHFWLSSAHYPQQYCSIWMTKQQKMCLGGLAAAPGAMQEEELQVYDGRARKVLVTSQHPEVWFMYVLL